MNFYENQFKPYSVEEEGTIETDASQRAIAAIVTQNKHPVAYLSKNLSNAERNWWKIEREAYAIYWAITKLKHILLGRKFSIKSDHKPLKFIFSEKSGVSTRARARISRWALELMPYEFNINYKPGEEIPHVDMLSRMTDNVESETIFHTATCDIPFSGSEILSKVK